LRNFPHMFLFLCGLLLVSGCGGRTPMLQELGPLPPDAGCRVAVLPLINRGDYPGGNELVYKIFTTELAAAGRFHLVNEADIRKVYNQLTLFPTRMADENQMQVIASRLGVTLFAGGDILRMTERPAGNEVHTELSLVIRLYDGKTGGLLWETYHKRRGRDYKSVLHFGQINTVAGLSKQMVREIIELWSRNGLTACSE
jgi:hypothetical protein